MLEVKTFPQDMSGLEVDRPACRPLGPAPAGNA